MYAPVLVLNYPLSTAVCSHRHSRACSLQHPDHVTTTFGWKSQRLEHTAAFLHVCRIGYTQLQTLASAQFSLPLSYLALGSTLALLPMQFSLVLDDIFLFLIHITLLHAASLLPYAVQPCLRCFPVFLVVFLLYTRTDAAPRFLTTTWPDFA